MANGPVDLGTRMQIQGNMQMERGFARAWSAGSSETVKAAYMQSAAKKGAISAQNIRNRYYKKEFEQVLEIQIKPLNERLAEAKEAYRQRMMTTVMPVGKTVGPSDYQEMANSLGQGGVPQLTTVPGASSADGAQSSEVIPQQAAAPNEALGKQIGAVEYEDSLALIDPASGVPVPFSSGRGVNIWNEATNDFWGEYSSVTQEQMQIMSKYVGNPYADKYSESLIDMVIKQGNIAATGQTDPTKAQEWWEGRKQFEAEQELRQQDVAAGNLSLESNEASLSVTSRDAQRLAETDPAFADLVGNKIMDKFASGEPLSRRETLEAASAVRIHRDLQEKQIAQRARSRVFTISPTNLSNPGNWQSEMSTRDPRHKQYYGEAYGDLVNNQQIAVARMSPEDRAATLNKYGATADDIQFYEEAKQLNPSVQAAFERMANSMDAVTEANDRAMLRRLPELERQQPELVGVIDQTIENAIVEMQKRLDAQGEGKRVDAEMLRSDRYRSFLEITMGREAPQFHDPRTLSTVADVHRRRQLLERPSQVTESEALVAPPASSEPPKATQPKSDIIERTLGFKNPIVSLHEGLSAVSPRGLYASVFKGVGQAATEAVETLAETGRYPHGRKVLPPSFTSTANPQTSAGKSPEVTEALKIVSASSLGESSSRFSGEDNPYIGLDVEVLKNMLAVMSPGSSEYSLVEEALPREEFSTVRPPRKGAR